MSDENLWGEIPVADRVETPSSILRGQATALRKITGGILDARIVTSQAPGDYLEHDFRIVAPALGNYSTEILSVRHSAELYPTSVVSPDLPYGSQAKDAEELKLKLKTVLQSDRVRKIVAGLVAQSREMGIAQREEQEAV